VIGKIILWQISAFFSWKILPICQNHTFQVGIWQKFANKKKRPNSEKKLGKKKVKKFVILE